MRFIQGPPALAVEVRSENDYGERAEAELARKRDDYFAAGTQVVWDVDPLDEAIHVYRASPAGPPRHLPSRRRGGGGAGRPGLARRRGPALQLAAPAPRRRVASGRRKHERTLLHRLSGPL
jgi:hypothetical protein